MKRLNCSVEMQSQHQWKEWPSKLPRCFQPWCSRIKPYKTSTSKDYSKCIERIMVDYEAGHLLALFEEAKSIQVRLITSTAPRHSKTMVRRFPELMMLGKVEAATLLIIGENLSNSLPLNHSAFARPYEKNTYQGIL